MISMMVGMLLALLAVAAMLSQYKVTVAVSTSASRSAIRDGELASAFMTAQIELQQAGYGPRAIPAATCGSMPAGGRVVWRYRALLSDPGFTCAGLRIDTDNAVEDNRGLFFLPGQACASADDSLDWTGEQRLATASVLFIDPNGEAGHIDLSGAAFGQTTAACWPYGQRDPAAPPTNHRRVDLSAGGVPVVSACLSNL